MTDERVPADRLHRILSAVETIEESLGVLARKQRISREDYKTDSDTRDIVERRFVKMTEAAIDIAEELVKHERGTPPASKATASCLSRPERRKRSLSFGKDERGEDQFGIGANSQVRVTNGSHMRRVRRDVPDVDEASAPRLSWSCS
jgi:hypothetical protein